MATADLTAGTLNIKIGAGQALSLPLTYKVDGVATSLVGHALSAVVLKGANVIATITIDRSDDANGNIVLLLSDEANAAIPGCHRWYLRDDTDDNANGLPRKLLEGDYEVEK